MATAIVVFLTLIVVFALTFKVSQVAIGRSVGRVVSARHHAAEEMVDSGAVPSAWVLHHEATLKRAKRLARGKSEEEIVASVEARSKQRALDGLADLIEYFRRAPVFDSEETRQEMLSELIEIGTRWETSSWSEMTQFQNDDQDEIPSERDDEDTAN